MPDNLSELEEELRRLTASQAPQAPQFEELEKAVGEAPPTPVAPAAAPVGPPQEAPQQPPLMHVSPYRDVGREAQDQAGMELEAELRKLSEGVVTPPQAPTGAPEVGYGQLFSDAVNRSIYEIQDSWGGFKAQVDALQHGDQGLADAVMEARKLKRQAAGLAESRESLEGVWKDPSRMLRWATEFVGEQLPIIGAGLVTGGSGALAGLALRKAGSYAIPALARIAAPTVAKLSAGASVFAGADVLETASSASDFYEKTGHAQPGAAIAAGALKAGVEVMPFGISRVAGALVTPGRQLAKKGLAREVGGVALGEAGEELTQTEVDIQFRAGLTAGQKDPYNAWGKEAWWERAEAAVGGALGGTVIGGPGAALEMRQEKRKEIEDDPGYREPYKSPVMETKRAIEAVPQAVGSQAPVEPEHDRVLSDIMHPITPATDDPANLSVQLKALADESGPDRMAFAEVMEGNTDRYALVGEDGRAMPYLYTDTELERKLSVDPQSRGLKVLRVDQGTVNPRDMTADVFDLAPADSKKIWFLPEVPMEQRAALREQYRAVQEASEAIVQSGGLLRDIETESANRTKLQEMIRPLVAAGLRVLPSYGRSFWYNGKFDSTPTVPDSTGRTKQIGRYNPRTNQVELQFDKLTSDPPWGGIPVSLDLRRLKPGEVSGVPEKIGMFSFSKLPGWHFAEGVTEAKKQEMFAWLDKTAAVEPSAEHMQKMMEAGIWYETSKGQKALVPRAGLDLRHYTYGVRRDRAFTVGEAGATESSKYADRRYAKLLQGKTVVELRRPTGAEAPWSDEVEVMAERMEREAKIYAPKIDRLMRMLGMPGGLQITISTDYPTSALPEHGTINFNPEFELESVQAGRTTGSFAFDFNSTMLHEVGHIVTLNLWRTLTPQMKLVFKGAYNRALLSDRMKVDAERHSRTFAEFTATKGGPANTVYYQGFAEWLAEQFRRHARTNEVLRNEFEFSMPRVQKGLNNFYAKWEKIAGTRGVFNLRHTDHYVGAVLDNLMRLEEKIAPVRQMEQKQELYRLADGIAWSPASQEVMKLAISAIESLGPMAVAQAPVVVTGAAPPGAGARLIMFPGMNAMPGTAYGSRGFNPVALLEVAVGAVKTKEQHERYKHAISKGWMHAYMELGLLSVEEMRTLAAAAKAEGIVVDSNTVSVVRQKARGLSRQFGWAPETEISYVEDQLSRMLIAEYVGQYAEGMPATAEARSILERILAVFRRIAEVFSGAGYDAREQLLRSIFNGEIASRYQPAKVGPQPTPQPGGVLQGPLNARPSVSTSVVKVDNELNALVEEYGGRGPSAKSIIYYFFEGGVPRGGIPAEHRNYVGYVELKNRNKLGFEVDMVEVTEDYRGRGYAKRIHEFWSKTLGMEHKPSGILTPDGFNYWKKKNPDAVRYHQLSNDSGVPGAEVWVSPRKIEQWIILTEMGLRRSPDADARARAEQERKLRYYKNLRARVNPKAWGDPDLKRMFGQSQADANGVQGAIVRGNLQADAQGIVDAVEGMEGTTTDAFDEDLQQTLQWSQLDNAKILGVPFEEAAAQTTGSQPLRAMAEWKGASPSEKKALKKVAAGIDRINLVSRWWWGLQQLAWVNTHIKGLQKYVQHAQQMAQRASNWMTRADETVRAWEKLPDARRKIVGDMLFWMAEQQYLTPEERQNKVTRWPTNEELVREAKRRKMRKSELDFVTKRIAQDFSQFFDQVERVVKRNLADTPMDEQVRAAKLAELAKQMSEIRAKPYFPFLRFGKYTLTGRDGTGKRVFFSGYQTKGQRDKALPLLQRQNPGVQFLRGTMPAGDTGQFMGLPPPMLDFIKDNMPDLTDEQLEWMEDYKAAHLQGNSFRRTWLQPTGVQGYSLDAFRSYAEFFMNGSKYLARMEFDGQLRRDIAEVQATTRTPIRDPDKRQMIVDFMQRHYKDIRSGKNDWSKFRTFAAWWQLGFSVTAAGMNMTQIPHALSPYLRSTFGVAGTGTVQNTLKRFRRGATTKGLSPAGIAARAEMKAQLRLEVGQAAELASAAEAPNLLGLMAGSKRQRMIRQWAHAGMWMFSKVEHFNREISFRSAWDLAMKYPDNPKLKQIERDYEIEIMELIERFKLPPEQGGHGVQIGYKEAVAFLYAREAIDRTQGNYAPWARPLFMRNKWAATALMFTQYMQTMLYAFRHNGAMAQMLLIGVFLYGLQGGLPGSEDFEEVLKNIGWHFFGQNWNIEREARRFIADMVAGEQYDEIAIDLLMHGISRYSFGVGLVPEGWGMPRFDVSGNGSMAKVVPGMADVLSKTRWGGSWEGASSAAFKALGGAGLGPVFALIQYYLDGKRLEGPAQRAVRDAGKAVRYVQEGETTKQGGRVIQWDIRDPDDATTLALAVIGARPTAVSQYWEGQRAFADDDNYYKARRTLLNEQMYEAVRDGNQRAIDDTTAGVQRFNEDLRARGEHSQQVDPNRLKASVKARLTKVQKQEEHVAPTKSGYSTFENMKKLYPGMVVEEKHRVK